MTQRETRIITLLTDFGLADPFVAEMKGVILSICPAANIVDIGHEVEKFNVRAGSFLLASAARYFPPGTTHVAVVDPGVGSDRKPIVVQTQRAVYVGPDNGLLIPAAQIDGITHVYEITNRSLMREKVSATFHGRDIFAPIAAHLVSGTEPVNVGPELSQYVKPSFSTSTLQGRSALCEVYHVDSFGNVITNVPIGEFAKLGLKLGDRMAAAIGRRRFSLRVVETYSDLREAEVGILDGSHGFVEIACREKSAARRLGVRSGNALRLSGAPGNR